MKQTVNIVIITFVVIAVIWAAIHFAGTDSFRVATTPAEKALDATLKKVGDDEHLFENSGIRIGAVPAKQRADYSRMLTRRLMAVLAAEEARLVKEQCGGQYIEGELCGLEYNPILCAQDTEELYYYHTLHQQGDTAIIEYSWPHQQNRPVAHYTMLRGRDGWKIDAVRCMAQ